MFDFENSTSKAELVDFAIEFGLDLDNRLSVEKMKELIRSAVAERSMDQTEAVQQSDKFPTVTIQIHKTDGDTGSDDVPISVNGKTWLIKRGFDVEVPEFVVEVLKNAVRDVFEHNPNTNETRSRQVPAYPFSVIQ